MSKNYFLTSRLRPNRRGVFNLNKFHCSDSIIELSTVKPTDCVFNDFLEFKAVAWMHYNMVTNFLPESGPLKSKLVSRYKTKISCSDFP